MMRISLMSLVLMLFLFIASFAQPVILLSGKVMNGSSGVKVDILFKDDAGNLVRASSASNGTYQTVLKSGHKYGIIMTDENLVRYTFSYDVPNYDKYTELTQDFPIGVMEATAPPKQMASKTKKKTKSKKSKKGK